MAVSGKSLRMCHNMTFAVARTLTSEEVVVSSLSRQIQAGFSPTAAVEACLW